MADVLQHGAGAADSQQFDAHGEAHGVDSQQADAHGVAHGAEHGVAAHGADAQPVAAVQPPVAHGVADVQPEVQPDAHGAAHGVGHGAAHGEAHGVEQQGVQHGVQHFLRRNRPASADWLAATTAANNATHKTPFTKLRLMKQLLLLLEKTRRAADQPRTTRRERSAPPCIPSG